VEKRVKGRKRGLNTVIILNKHIRVVNVIIQRNIKTNFSTIKENIVREIDRKKR
jgi:hypothetical protein